MFENVGAKIMGVAKVICWVGIIISVIMGLIMMAAGGVLYGILTIAVGSIMSWLGSLTTYGFGRLIENTDILVELLENTDTTHVL